MLYGCTVQLSVRVSLCLFDTHRHSVETAKESNNINKCNDIKAVLELAYKRTGGSDVEIFEILPRD